MCVLCNYIFYIISCSLRYLILHGNFCIYVLDFNFIIRRILKPAFLFPSLQFQKTNSLKSHLNRGFQLCSYLYLCQPIFDTSLV